MAAQGSAEWQVTAVAPARLQGDLRYIELEAIPNEACSLVPVNVRFDSHPHLRVYGRELRSVLRQPWDVVHAWEEPYVLASAQIARLVQSGVKYVPATFQNINKNYPTPIDMIERRVMHRANGWIAFGQTAHDAHCARPGYAGKPSRVLTPGVDVERFRPDPDARASVRNMLGWKTEDRVVGFAGRLVEEKGIDTVLHAFTHSQHSWNLLVVGGGELSARVESFRLRYPARIRLASDVDHAQMPEYLRAMDVLCAPSRTTTRWREQFGRMLIEAMACGVPVVASDSGEIPYVVQDAGVILPEDDLGQWTTAVDQLVADPAARARLANRGVARAHSEFSWRVVARRHLDFFDEVLSQ
jgi:phosphatidyl-myo-inositol dimannoside synthase